MRSWLAAHRQRRPREGKHRMASAQVFFSWILLSAAAVTRRKFLVPRCLWVGATADPGRFPRLPLATGSGGQRGRPICNFKAWRGNEPARPLGLLCSSWGWGPCPSCSQRRCFLGFLSQESSPRALGIGQSADRSLLPAMLQQLSPAGLCWTPVAAAEIESCRPTPACRKTCRKLAVQ